MICPTVAERFDEFMYGNILDTIGFVKEADKEVGDAMELEFERQQHNIELIASENFVSPAVMGASVITAAASMSTWSRK